MIVWLAAGCIGIGLIFNILAVAGALRFPDVFTRAQALGMADTLGVLGVLAGLMALHGVTQTSAKLFLLLVVLFILNPTIIHALLNAALQAGVKPWEKSS